MKKIERTDVDSDLLRTFLEIAECGNLTLAATRLCRTQSAISVQLRKLETALKVPLFSRRPKGMELTEAGQTLLPVARSALAEMARAARLFEAPLRGRLRIGIPDDFEGGVLERALAAFARRHPEVNVIAICGCTSGFRDAVAKGDLDVAVCSGPLDTAEDVFASEPSVWAASNTWVPVPEDPVRLAVLDRSCWWRDLPLQKLDEVGRAHSVAFRSSSFSGVKSAIRAGFAVGVLPASCVDQSIRILSADEGFPQLPSAGRELVVRPEAPEDLAGAMTLAIREACR